ncbi:uncharacterized protein LOC141697603 isoform X2 [Apium graveolens]|uniref:uncharacterized protein LOC141697603 isoform X2 n=1 Tax=Apium graveolens TaxID=4045 RepID=UPI003D7974D3
MFIFTIVMLSSLIFYKYLRFEGDRPRFRDMDGYRAGPRGPPEEFGGEKGGTPAGCFLGYSDTSFFTSNIITDITPYVQEFQAASQLLLYTLLMLYSFSCSYLPCSYGIGCIERRLKELHRLSYKELCASEDMANGSLDNFLYVILSDLDALHNF